MPHRRIALLGLAAALLLPLRVAATTVEAPEFRQLVGLSDYVVRGVVASVSSTWRRAPDGRIYIASQVEIEIGEIIKGTPPPKVVLEMVGGRVGDDELRIEGAPTFQIGEEDIFFVRGNGLQFYPLVGIMHGLYPILHDFTTGEDHVLRSNGMPLYSEQDVSLPMTRLSTTKAQNPAAQPMTATAFIRAVRYTPVRATQPAIED